MTEAARQAAPCKSEPPKASFVPITFQENWAVIRQIDEISGVSYDCN